MKAALGERVKDVRVTFRLTDSAACLVSDEHEMSGHLQRLLKAAGQKAPESRPILELNPTHPLVARLKSSEHDLADWAQLLFDQALLAEGGQLDEPAAFVQRVNRLLLDAGSQVAEHVGSRQRPRARPRRPRCAGLPRSSTRRSSG